MDALITPEMLAATGIQLADNEVADYLTFMNDQATERISDAIAENLGDEKLEELSDLQETASDEELNDWLQENIKDLAVVIQDEIDILMGEAVQNRDKINALQKVAA